MNSLFFIYIYIRELVSSMSHRSRTEININKDKRTVWMRVNNYALLQQMSSLLMKYTRKILDPGR